jgi:hypothetical protein
MTGREQKILRWLQWPGRIAWRWFTGKPMDGVPRTDATWLARGTMTLDPGTAPRPPATLGEEIRGDVAQVREELELRRIARRVDADHLREDRGD